MKLIALKLTTKLKEKKKERKKKETETEIRRKRGIPEQIGIVVTQRWNKKERKRS